MFKIKIFLKLSTKKLLKLNSYKNKNLRIFINFLITENNKNLNIILKKILIFINILKKKYIKDFTENTIKETIYISNLVYLPSKKLKRIKFRAKGRIDNIEKRNSFLILGLTKKQSKLNLLKLKKKNYIYN